MHTNSMQVTQHKCRPPTMTSKEYRQHQQSSAI